MNWQGDGPRFSFSHPRHGWFFVRTFDDGTACATRCKLKSSTVEMIVPASKLDVSIADAKAACERRIAELDGL